ncbi:MAG TPA: hypothetical protein VGP70_10705 [Actinomadura sp.]|nr:hypothetical protein [Actinomadura sp.]
MTEGHELRWGGAAGVGAVVFALLGRLVMGNPPAITDSTGTIASYISGHRGQIITAMVLFGIAIAMFVWFGAALATAFRRAEETSDAPAVLLAGTAFTAAIAFVSVGLFAGMTYAMTFHPGMLAGASGPYTAITVLTTLAGLALAVPLIASAIAIMHTGVFPAWVAGLAALAAALSVLAAIGIASTRGAFRPGSALMYLPWVVTAVWVLAASALLIREHLPAIPARAPHAMGRA